MTRQEAFAPRQEAFGPGRKQFQGRREAIAGPAGKHPHREGSDSRVAGTTQVHERKPTNTRQEHYKQQKETVTDPAGSDYRVAGK